MHKFQVTTIAVLLAMGGVMAAPAHAGVLDGFFNGLRDKANAAQSAIENIGAGKPKQNIDPAYKQVLLDGLKQLGVSEGVAQTSLVLLGGSLMSGDPTTGASDGITIKVKSPSTAPGGNCRIGDVDFTRPGSRQTASFSGPWCWASAGWKPGKLDKEGSVLAVAQAPVHRAAVQPTKHVVAIATIPTTTSQPTAVHQVAAVAVLPTH